MTSTFLVSMISAIQYSNSWQYDSGLSSKYK